MLQHWLKCLLRILIRIHYFLFGGSAKPLPKLTDLSSALLSISGGIGDALMAQPMVRALRQMNPHLKIDVLVSPATQILYEKDTDINRVWAVNNKLSLWVQLILKLRHEHYDVYIGKIPSNTIRKTLLPYLAGIPVRVKHRTWERKCTDYDFLYQHIESINMERHRILCNLDLLKPFGVDPSDELNGPHLEIDQETSQSALLILSQLDFDTNKLTIGFHPGCNPSRAHKRWSAENYAALGNYLQQTYGAQIVIVGGKDEIEDIKKVASCMVTPPVIVAGRCTLLETAAIIKLCSLFISNDSGIMHLAAALDIPTFAIFGPTDDRHIGPFGKKHTVIRNTNDINTVTMPMVLDKIIGSTWGISSFLKRQNAKP